MSIFHLSLTLAQGARNNAGYYAADYSAAANDRAYDETQLIAVQMVHPAEERWSPGETGEVRKGGQACSCEDQQKRLVLEKIADGVAQGVEFRVDLGAVGKSAGRLFHGEVEEGGGDQAGNACKEERRPPAVVLRDDAADQEAEVKAQVRRHIVDGRRKRSPVLREVVGNERQSRRGACRLSHTHAHPEDEHLECAPRHPAQSGHHAPDHEAYADDRCARFSVCEACDRYGEDEIDEGESETDHHAEHGVGKGKFFLYGIEHHGEDVPVEEAKRPNEREKTEDVAPSCR